MHNEDEVPQLNYAALQFNVEYIEKNQTPESEQYSFADYFLNFLQDVASHKKQNIQDIDAETVLEALSLCDMQLESVTEEDSLPIKMLNHLTKARWQIAHFEQLRLDDEGDK